MPIAVKLKPKNFTTVELEVIGRDELGRSQYFQCIYPDYVRRNSQGILCAVCRGLNGEEYEIAYEDPRSGAWIWIKKVPPKDWRI